MNKPIILLCGAENKEISSMPLTYIRAVIASGGVPLIVPPEKCILKHILSVANGVVLIGGGDVNAEIYDGNSLYSMDVDEKRDHFEIEIVRYATKQNIPVLGICRGCQVINVAFGGDLYDDIPDHNGQQHTVSINTDSILYNCAETDTLTVNSHHHQACKKMGNGLRVTAISSDGVTEAFESTRNYCHGVQFHPERDLSKKAYTNIFRHFVNKCSQVSLLFL